MEPPVEGKLSEGFLDVLYRAGFKDSKELEEFACSGPLGVVWSEKIGGK